MGDKHSKQPPTCAACDKTGLNPDGTPISPGDTARRGSLPIASSTPRESPSTSQRGRASTLPTNTKRPDRKSSKSGGTSKFPIQLRLDHRGSEKSLAPKDKVQTPKPNKKDIAPKDKESASKDKENSKSKTLPAKGTDSKGSGKKSPGLKRSDSKGSAKTPPAKPPPPLKRTDSQKSSKSQSGKSPGVKRSGSTASQKGKSGLQLRLDHKGSEKSSEPKEKGKKEKGKGKDSAANKTYIDHNKGAAPQPPGTNGLPTRQSINVLEDSPSTKRKIPPGDIAQDNIEFNPEWEEAISVEQSHLAESAPPGEQAPPVPAKANTPKGQDELIATANEKGVVLRRKPNQSSSPKKRPVPIDATVKTIEATVRMRQKVHKQGETEETFVTDLELLSKKTIVSQDQGEETISVEQSNLAESSPGQAVVNNPDWIPEQSGPPKQSHLAESSPVQAVVNNPVESGPPQPKDREYSDVPVESQESPCKKRKSTRPKSMMSPLNMEGADTSRYQKIKAECLKEGKLWEDHDFPAVDSSIFYSMAPPRPFAWKRPKVSIYSLIKDSGM